MKKINILSGGAAQALIDKVRSQFLETYGFNVEGHFGAVGLMKERLLSGDKCDVLILTRQLIDELVAQGKVVAGSARDLGAVPTGVALRSGTLGVSVNTAKELKQNLEAADEIYFPDPEKATAGIHFLSVLKKLGLDQGLADRFRLFPNGITAMGALSRAISRNPIGCTQVTEILYTDGVVLAGYLPDEFKLETVYTAAVTTSAQNPQEAQDLIELIASPEKESLRTTIGFT